MSLFSVKAPGNARFPTKYSQSWMDLWVNAAATIHSLKDLNTAAGVTMWDYHQGRMLDPDFDAAALILDQIVDLQVLSSVRDKAMDGDSRAQVLYYTRARLPAFHPAFPTWLAPSRYSDDDDSGGAAAMAAIVTPIEPRLAEIMTAAGLRALEKRPRRRDRKGDDDGEREHKRKREPDRGGGPLPCAGPGRETRRRRRGTPTSS